VISKASQVKMVPGFVVLLQRTVSITRYCLHLSSTVAEALKFSNIKSFKPLVFPFFI
jgi:hypothetical protein